MQVFLRLKFQIGKMKNFLLIAIIWASSFVRADTLNNCLTLQNTTNQNATATSAIVEHATRRGIAMSAVITANNVSGTSPTLDVVLDTCRTASGLCKSTQIPVATCTTGSCYTDGYVVIDLNKNNFNWWRYFRVRTTLGGTTPVYNVKVELCYTS